MARVEVKVGIVQRTLENGTCVAEAIMLPDDPLDYDPVYFSDTVRRSRTAALKLAHNRLEGSDPGKLQGVSIPESFQIIPIEVEIEPPKRSPAWVGPVVLTFDTVQWMHSESYAVAYVPALRIYVIADSMESMKKRLLAHTRFALFRNELAKSLWDLVKLQRTATTKADVIDLVINIASPKNRAQRQEKDEEEEDEQTTLKKIATNLSGASQPPAYHVEKEVLQVAEALQGKRAGSVLLLGPSGVGKTAIVHELVRNRATLDLHHRTFYATSGSRLIAGMGGFGMWQERCRTICKEAKELQAVLHVGGLIELMEVGKSMYNQNGIASFLRPYLLKGDLQIIAECTPDEITAIEREDPHLLQAFHRVDVHEPGQQTARDILRHVALQLPASQPSPIREDALDLIDRLHRRYATYSAYPGRPIRFLRNLLKDTPMDRAANARDVLRAFTRETGIPETILDEDAAFDLAATRMWFEERIMGQSEAIEQVVDLLAVIKSRLSRPRKPLASFLFAGPTGVGKTETAKALAEFLFGGKDRMFRFDMSEFSDPYGAARLISGTAEGEGLLTRTVREQPFCVLLLDEFEKAHPSTYDLLLQVLGEGRLSDQKGRVADFCNSIIIMTSNLGAGSYQQSSLGFANTKDLRGQAREHFSGEVRKFLRPEMFNRIDAIIAFSPLDRETVSAIARRELAAVQKRDGLQYRGAAITFTDALSRFITDQGFDPRYGARPIKRAIEDTVVTPLACRMNAYADDVHLRGEVKTQDDAVHIHLTGPAESDSDDTVQPKGSSSLQELGEACADLRRKAYRLKSCGSIIHIENELFRAERMEKTFMRRLRQRPKSVIPPPELKQITSLRELLQEAESLYARAKRDEEEKRPIKHNPMIQRITFIQNSYIPTARFLNDLL